MTIKQKYIFDQQISVKSADDDKYLIECIGTEEIADRDGDIVKIDGIDLGNYRKNPTVFWSHNYYEPPIGKTVKVWKDSKQLKFRIEFVKGEDYPLAGTIYKLYKNGFLNSFSIGFKPDPQFAKFNEKRGGYDFDKVELIEISAVSIPSNVRAVLTDVKMQDAIKTKMFTDQEVTGLERFLKEMEDDIMLKEDTLDETIQDLSEEISKEYKDFNAITKQMNDFDKRLKQIESDINKIREQIKTNSLVDSYLQNLLSEDLEDSGKSLENQPKDQPSEFEEYCKELLGK